MTTLYVTERAWQQIEQAVTKNPSVETGGILMGYKLNEDWVVSYASEPGPRAIKERKTVVFDENHLRNLTAKLKLRSAGRLRYIGDWHSHTVKRLAPSQGDRKTFALKTYQETYQSPSPIMLIVGMHRRGIRVKGYIYGGRLREVDKVILVGKQGSRQLN
ncbi:Mov34/MPN/PAD-1 family protein [Brevibacillus massiliensis]|jgi:integrative and conjugative element protein (TIGR02256 family)|uniref:Mov34/MPN/PAD-1 family protein n=1 Tax=Brevibacillus massiliensis TaxID=1118054 RepID=UPI0002FEFF9B|nr:Mov34/MPN/PAD-1 family protein [Brevibacillus massiliensis]